MTKLKLRTPAASSLRRLAKNELHFVRRRVQQHEKADDRWVDGRQWPLKDSWPAGEPRQMR